MAALYEPLPFRRLGSLLERGDATEEQVRKSVLASGYSSTDTDSLMRLLVRNAKLAKADDLGLPKESDARKLYSEYLISDDEYVIILRDRGWQDSDIRMSLDIARQERSWAERKEGLAHLKARYVSGETSDVQALAFMSRLKIDAVSARQLIALWQDTVTLKHHAASQGELLGWVEQGIITPEEAMLRMVRQGTSEIDAARALRAAKMKLDAKSVQQAQRVATQIAQQRERAARSKAAGDAKLARHIERETEQVENELSKLQDKLAKQTAAAEKHESKATVGALKTLPGVPLTPRQEREARIAEIRKELVLLHAAQKAAKELGQDLPENVQADLDSANAELVLELASPEPQE